MVPSAKFDSSSSSDESSGSRGFIAKDIPENQKCSILHFWRLCERPDCHLKHVDQAPKDSKIREHVTFLRMVDKHGLPNRKRPEGAQVRTGEWTWPEGKVKPQVA
jgi:hypothetical protein